MAQHDVHRNVRSTGTQIPFLLDVQADLLQHLMTRVVIPLRPEGTMVPAGMLNPIFTVEGQRLILATAELAAVPITSLGPRVASLEAQRYDIIAAIDLLITGI
jgi:toxin CcdB